MLKTLTMTAIAGFLACGADDGMATAPVLPPLLPEQGLSVLDRLQVQRFEFSGNSVFSDQRLAELLADYTGRFVTVDELHAAVNRVTALYADAGFATSGALLPDQDVQNGIVQIQVIEGSIKRIEVSGSRYLHPDWLAQRLATDKPFRVDDLRARVTRLQARPPIRRIDARVSPGGQPGEATLRVQVEERNPVELQVTADNRRSPSVGSQRLELAGTWHSPLGWGDTLDVRHSFNRGPDDYAIDYRVPLTADDLTLALAVEESGALVQEAPFNRLDMRSELSRYELGLEWPLVRSPGQELTLSASIEHRHAKTYLLGFPFSFAPGVVDGVSRVTNTHLVQQWTRREPDQVLALRSDFRFGIEALAATVHHDLPDGRFSAWQGQLQWMRRLPGKRGRLAARAVVQRTDDALLPSEKFSLGGMDTVRGYRESSLSRDNAVSASLEWWLPAGEWRIPGISQGAGDGRVEFALFYDYGQGSNKFQPTPRPESISSVGLGLSWQPSPDLSGKLFWGHPLRQVPDTGQHDLQDDGVHFQFRLRLL